MSTVEQFIWVNLYTLDLTFERLYDLKPPGQTKTASHPFYCRQPNYKLAFFQDGEKWFSKLADSLLRKGCIVKGSSRAHRNLTKSCFMYFFNKMRKKDLKPWQKWRANNCWDVDKMVVFHLNQHSATCCCKKATILWVSRHWTFIFWLGFNM